MSDPMQGLFQGLDIAAAGLRAEFTRSEIVAANIGNMHRTGNKHREPYRRKSVVFEEVLQRVGQTAKLPGGDRLAMGVRVREIADDRVTPFPSFYHPGHADADETGQVLASNVDIFQELVDMSVIERSFDANLAAMRTYRTMLQNVLANMRTT